MRIVVYTLAACFLLVGAFAPVIANDVPVVARVDGELRFPAFYSYVGKRATAPGKTTWKEWWVDLREDSPDWAVMPFIPYGPDESLRGRINARPTLFVHYLGNDDTGRDVLTRMIHGASTALLIAVGVVLLAALIGVPLGAAAGYWGGLPDALVTGLLQVFLCFPPFFFVLAVMTFLGSSLTAVILVLGLLYWVSFARIVRGEFLSLREREFVTCARGLGVGSIGLIVRHILPAAKGPILVNAAFVGASAIVVEATLSFLGLGPGLRTASWGQILMEGKDNAHTGAWHLWVFPSIVLVATVFCLHSLADRGQRGCTRSPVRVGS